MGTQAPQGGITLENVHLRKQIDRLDAKGYWPLLVVFQNDKGDVRLLSMISSRSGLQDFLQWLATDVPDPIDEPVEIEH